MSSFALNHTKNENSRNKDHKPGRPKIMSVEKNSVEKILDL